MKEININIEGYNVNGICVGCLNYNRKMFYSDEIKYCFKLLANIDVPDGLSVQVCWECLAYVKSVMKFQQQILNAYDVLIQYSLEQMFLNSPKDLTKHAIERLSITKVETLSNVSDEDPNPDLKSEVIVKIDGGEEVKIEDIDDDEAQAFEPVFCAEVPCTDELSIENGVSSDDDIQLSKLKETKEKKVKKRSKRDKRKNGEKSKRKEKEEKRRKSRIFKNLPEEVVEVYTMTEEEMWVIRNKDLDNKDFARLKYKCDDCLIGFNTEKLMTDHMMGKHKPKSENCHQCYVCKGYFLTTDNLTQHKALHLRAYRCMICDVRTSLKRIMLRHIQIHMETFKCNECEKVFSTKSKLTYHKSMCNQERPQCDCCGKVFVNKMSLKYHLKILPENKSKPKEKLFIPCKGCDKVFHSKKSYRAHVVIHDGRTYPCPTCGKLFQWKRNLARHARNHRDKDAGARHECRECGKTFSSKDCYNNHMRFSKRHVSTDTYTHVCNYCGKKFATKWCMVDHIDWEHLKKIKYQCSVCFKAFKTAKIMVAHINNIHENKRNVELEGEHLCEICGKSYKTVKRLKGHVWAMHTNRSTTKSFKCSLCPATFAWQTSIYKHMKMMHDNKRNKPQPRPLPAVKKPDPYPGIELANRMQYFQQNLAPNLVQSIIPSVPPSAVVQNIV